MIRSIAKVKAIPEEGKEKMTEEFEAELLVAKNVRPERMGSSTSSACIYSENLQRNIY